MKTAFLVIMILNLLAPMPPGVAMNPDTGECGSYMGGDEYASYPLPEPWVVNYGDPIEDKNGSHHWDGNADSIEAFCTELGYTYVPGNLATLYGQRKSSPVFFTMLLCKTLPFLLLAIVIITVVLLIVRRKKKRAKMQG